MASFSQISSILKEVLREQSDDFVENSTNYIFTINNTEYSVPKPQVAHISAIINHNNITPNGVYRIGQALVNDLKKGFNVTTTFVGEVKFLEPAYHPTSDECIIRLVGCIVPTDNERIFFNGKFHDKLLDLIDD